MTLKKSGFLVVKVLAAILVVGCMFVAEAFAANVNLSWNANGEEDLAGYVLYVGTQSGNYSSTIDIGNQTTYTLSSLADGTTYYLALAAYDSSDNYSNLSNEINHTTDAETVAPTSGTASSPQYSNQTTFNVTYSGAADNVGGSGLDYVSLWARKNSGGWYNTGQTRSTGSGSFSFTTLSGDGVIYFSVVATDNAGNSSAAPIDSGQTVTILDTQAPETGVVTVPATTESSTVTVSYSGVTDSGGSNLSVANLWVKNPAGTWAFSNQINVSTSGSFTYPFSEAGDYRFALRTIDNAGNSSAIPSGNDGAATEYIITSPPPPPPSNDLCPNDPAKVAPGVCGCGISDADTDGDGTADCDDQCQFDSQKTSPGICGCGVVDSTVDTDGDGNYNCNDSDDDNDTLSDAEEANIGTNPLLADTDQDEVSDAQELVDGTNPLDRGSVKVELGTEICSEWNGFLEKLWNILELVNMSNKELSVEATLHNQSGDIIETSSVTIHPGSQIDLLVHDKAGRERNSYGLFCIAHSGETGDLDGRMVYYKGSRNKFESSAFEFAFAMPFSNGNRGRQFVTFNTYQPSTVAKDRDNLVANWIQLTNLSKNIGTGKLKFYGFSGEELGAQDVTLAPSERIDFSGHQFGPDIVGVVKWMPNDETISYQLRNIRYLYDNSRGSDSFDTAFQLAGQLPSGELLSVPITTDGETAILEVVNVLSEPVDTVVNFYGQDGTVRATHNFTLGGNSSRHIITNEFMQAGERGIAVVKGNKTSSLISVAMQYGRTDKGGISYMYGVAAKPAVGDVLRNSYNTYLEQTSKLVLTNPTDTEQEVSFTLVRSTGETIILGEPVTIPAHTAEVIILNNYEASGNYGVVTVTPENTNSIVAWVKRERNGEYVIPTPSR